MQAGRVLGEPRQKLGERSYTTARFTVGVLLSVSLREASNLYTPDRYLE